MKDKIAHQRSSSPTALIRQLQPRATGRIGLRTTDGIEFIRLGDILCCEAWSNYCKIYLDGRIEPILISKPLKHVISVLPEDVFFRTHQSFLVRLTAIAAVKDEIALTNGITVPLSRRQKPAFMTWLKQNVTLI